MRMPNIRNEIAFAWRGVLLFQLTITALALSGVALQHRGVYDFYTPLLILSLAGVTLLGRAHVLIGRRFEAAAAAERERERFLSSDPLTGVLSRRSFIQVLGETVRFDSTKLVSLLLVDADHFKAVNDGFGHAAGDEVLRHIVATARWAFPDAVIGRLGGDEFALLVDGSAQDTLPAVEGFLATLRAPRTIAGRMMNVGTSIGLASAPDDASFPDELIGCADLALYESKRRGRGCVTCFDHSMMREAGRRRNVERELRAAVLLDEFDLHYQPILDVAGTCVAVEALVRWRHPLRGTVTPGEFIEIAEQSTLIDMIGEWVLRRAARDAPALGDLRIGINVSGAQLKRDELVDMVRRVLADTGCRADRLAFEITESIAFTATPAVLARLQALRDLGARVSLDDFGTGHNGFHSLHSLPVDSIKIDRSFVQAMGSDPVASVLVSAVGSIGRIQGLAVVAEGIETEAQRILTKAAGCTLFQGYFLGRPQPLGALVASLAAAPPVESGALTGG